MNIKRFLSFERMITPVIIKILFWIGLIISILAGLGVFFGVIIAGISDGDFASIVGGLLIGLVGGALVIFLGALITRIYAELLILVFQINESLTDIKELLKNQQKAE